MPANTRQAADPWSKLPKGWTEDSVKKFWDTLTGDVKHKVTKCIKKMEGSGMDDPGAFCASLADKVEGKGWRSEPRTATDIRSAVIRLAHENPELRRDLLAALKTAEPRYRDYVRRYKGEGSPMPKEEWEAKVLSRFKKKDKAKDKTPSEGSGKPGKKPSGEKAPAAPAKKYKHKQTPELKARLEKHNLHDDDAEEILEFKKGKPPTGKPLTDAQLLQRFLQKASPETKKRLMGPPKISPADFKAVYSAIMDDEEGGGGKQAAHRLASTPHQETTIMSDQALILRLAKLAREDESLRPHIMPILREATKKMAHGPVSMRKPDTMFFYIDPANNNSKFYEMRIVPMGQETRAQKSAGNPAAAQWVLERRWGRLTDTGATGRVDSYNEYWGDRRMAERSMMEHGRKRTGKGYKDVSRTQEYPIGLGSAGFGWGGQAACRVIPELQVLKEAMQKALAAVTVAERQLRPIAKQDSSMAQKLSGMLEGVEASLAAVVTYLDGQLSYCR